MKIEVRVLSQDDIVLLQGLSYRFGKESITKTKMC